MTQANLYKFYKLADDDDIREGKAAYQRYQQVMKWFAEYYDTPFDLTTACFVALSPNSDYFGNLRSLATLLKGFNEGRPVEDITVSTYKHCRDRAYTYLTREAVFMDKVKGPKIRAFYQNIIDPTDRHPVTIDGHMIAAWRDEVMTMKQANITRTDYNAVANDTRLIAYAEGLVANQVQAIIWFARKRVLNIKYSAQTSLFHSAEDKWGTLITPEQALPYKEQNP